MEPSPRTSLDPVEGETALRMWIRRSLYLLFGGIFLFEVLNYVHILSFPIDFTWLGRVTSTLVVFGILRAVDEVLKRTIGTRLQGTIWILMTIVLLVDFFGDVFGLYGRFEYYDQVAHFFSGPLLVISLLLVLETLCKRLRWNHSKAVTYLLALGINTIFAVFYEIEEYLEDYFFHSHRLGDGPDTANDLMLNLFGGIVLILVYIAYQRWNKMRRNALVQHP
jgi:cation transport ATPase